MNHPENRERFETAYANAKRILKKGDRLTVSKCPGKVRTITFSHWEGRWIVSKSGINDFAPPCVKSINRVHVDLTLKPYKDFMGVEWMFNDPVEAWGTLSPIEERSGRLVQVRKGVGPFGMDSYFIRKEDGQLCNWANVALRPYTGPLGEFCDVPDTCYTIKHEWPETGFVIEHPKQPQHPQQSFAMTIIQSS